MTVFLANRANLQTRRLHTRIKHLLEGTCTDVRMRVAGRRDPGRYRVVGELDPRSFLECAYETDVARLEVGFQLATGPEYPYEFYWLGWIEPERDLLVGWHRDDTHDDPGPVHLQVNHGAESVVHRSVEPIDSHPLDVVGKRLEHLPAVVSGIEWVDGEVAGLEDAAVARS